MQGTVGARASREVLLMRGRQGQQPSRQGACCWRMSVKMQGRVGARASGALLLQVLQPHRQGAGKGFEHARRMGVRAVREVVLMREGRRQVLKPRRQGARGFTHAGDRASRGTLLMGEGQRGSGQVSTAQI